MEHHDIGESLASIPIDIFLLNASDAQYLCVVYNAFGPTMATVSSRWQDKPWPIILIKKLLKETLIGLLWLHQRTCIIGGELIRQQSSST